MDYNYTREQQAAITGWRVLQTGHTASFCSPADLTRQVTTLRRANKIFNTIFFCRKLPTVYVNWSSPGIPGYTTPWVARTVTSARTFTRTRITLHAANVTEPRAATLFDALLHQ